MTLLDDASLVVCIGPGGVGKTTLASTLAIRAATDGRHVALLTVDPARRLASALGLDGLTDALCPVNLPGATGSLHAAMVDTRRSYDALIERIAGSPELAAPILDNRVYRAFSRTLARSHAYVASERLYDAAASGSFDLVVLDTPPMRSALDILDAPGRLVQFLEDDIVSWFLRPPAAGPLSRLARLGGMGAARLLGMLASKRLVAELATFLGTLVDFREGFAKRATHVRELFRDPTTRFVLVVVPTEEGVRDGCFLRDGLRERGIRLDGVIENAAFVAVPGDPSMPVDDSAASAPEGPADVLETLRELRRDIARQNADAEERARALYAGPAGQECRRARLAQVDLDEPSVSRLRDLAGHIRWRIPSGG